MKRSLFAECLAGFKAKQRETGSVTYPLKDADPIPVWGLVREGREL